MKKISAISLFLLLSNLLPSAIYAQSPSPTSSLPWPPNKELKELRQEAKDDRRQLRREIKDDLQELKNDRQEIKATISQQRKTLWDELKKKRVEFTLNRIRKEITLRFQSIEKSKAKIEERIKVKEANYDLTLAKASLAKYSTSSYQADLAKFEAVAQKLTSTDQPQTVLKELKDAAKVCQDDLKDLRQILVDTLKAIVSAPKK